MVFCSSSSNGRGPGGGSLDDGVQSVEKLSEEKRRAELSAGIASGKFTVKKSRYILHINVRNGALSYVALSQFCWNELIHG